MAPVPQVRVRMRPGTFARSYPLKRQVPLLKVQLEEVAYKWQTRGPRRVVLWTPPFEEISQEEKDDGPQQDSARRERSPEGSRQGAQRLQPIKIFKKGFGGDYRVKMMPNHLHILCEVEWPSVEVRWAPESTMSLKIMGAIYTVVIGEWDIQINFCILTHG